MNDEIILHRSVFVSKISDELYYVFNGRNHKSYRFGGLEGETLMTMQKTHSFKKLALMNQKRLSPQQLKAFLEQLNQLGFLKDSKVKTSQKINRIKFGLFNPSRYLKQDSTLIRIMHWLILWVPWIMLIFGIATMILSGNTDFGKVILSYRPNVKNVVFLLVATFLVTAVHEFAHACMTIYYGMPVPEIGIMLYWFTPCAYADLSATQMIQKKYQKILSMLAGIFTHLIWVGVGMCVYVMIPSLDDEMISFVLMNIILIVANSAFYIKLDGYHVLTILLDDPLLREHAISLLARQIKSPAIGYEKTAAYLSVAVVSIIYMPAIIISVMVRTLIAVGSLL